MGLNKESRTKNAGKNAASAVANKLIILLLSFINRRIFIRYIGVEYLGINGLFSNILTLLSMADLGLGTAMNVSLYKPIADGDTEKLAELLNYFRRVYYYIAAGVAAVGLALTPFLGYIVNMDSDIPYLQLYYIIFVLKNVVSYLFVYKSSIVKADQKMYLVNRVQVFANLLKVILQIVTIILFKNYLVYILLDVAEVLTENLTVSVLADRNYPFIKKKRELPQNEKKAIFSDIGSAFVYKISGSLINGTDNILLSVIVGTVFVGLYSNYYTITNTIETFIGLLFNSLTASVGNLVATSDAKKRFGVFRVMQMCSFWICGVVTVCLWFLMQDFIVLWLGEDLLIDNLTVIAIILNLFFSICMRPVWTFREGTGMYRQIKYIMLCTAIENIFLSIILGKIMGASGIIFATSISKITTYFWYEPNILFSQFFHEKVGQYYREYLINAVMILVCLGICYILTRWINGVSIAKWLAKAVICFSVVNVIYFFHYFRTLEFERVKRTLRKKIRN